MGCSADTDVGGTKEKDEVLEWVAAVEDNGSKALGTTEVEE